MKLTTGQRLLIIDFIVWSKCFIVILIWVGSNNLFGMDLVLMIETGLEVPTVTKGKK